MPSLRELQQRFSDAVQGPADAALAFVAGDPRTASERFAVYRDTVTANYRKALAASFPVVERLVGTPFFNAVVDAFVAACPSTSGDLNVFGDRLAEFLADYPPTASLPYLPDVARLEWAIDEANRAADVPRMPEAVVTALSCAPEERLPSLRLTLDPSCRLVASRFPVLRIWQMNQRDFAGDDAVSLDAGGDTLLVRRDAPGVALERLADGEHAWLAALAAGETLGAAIDAGQRADPAFDLPTALQAHVAAGTIVAVVDA